MTSLQRTAHSGHPAPGAVPTAAQKALQNERNSLTSFNAAGMAAAAAAAAPQGLHPISAAAAAAALTSPEDDDDVSSPVSASQLQIPSAPNVPLQQARSARNSAADGMRREWKFALQFVHAAGQLLVPCSPQWEYDFIDIDRTAYGLTQRTNSNNNTAAGAAAATTSWGDATPMLAVLAYTDRTAVIQPAAVAGAGGDSPSAAALRRHSGTSSVGGGGAAGAYDELLSHASLANTSVERVSDSAAAAAAGAGDWWVEKSKHVELFYCHPAPDMTMEQFCKHCVKFILRDPHVVSVDGDSRLTHLRVGDKLRCPHQLGGQYRTFHMRYVLRDRSELQESYVYAMGALVGQRGYLLRAQCTNADELEGYVRSALLPTYAALGRAQFGVDVTYHNVPPTTLLTDQQEAFGELQYVDHKAAIVFVTPVYPMKILPDYSPAKTVGVGSITCMTLELSVHERLLDDAVAAEIIGVAKYKVNPVVLCVEVEEVARMGYPKVMSTEQYSDLKAKRVADVFPDAKMVGLPTSLYMGNRTGRSRTMTFTYEPLRCVVKALVTSTLVGNFGVTAFYLTKLSGGLFDSHLYVFQQLLSGMEFLPQNNFAKNARVSRYRVQNIHLGEEDVTRAYRCVNSASRGSSHPSPHPDNIAAAGGGGDSKSAKTSATTASEIAVITPALALPPHPASFTTNDRSVVAAARERHLHMLTLGNDGRVEGGVEAAVPVEEGGLPSRRAGPAAAAATGRTPHGDASGRRPTAAGEAAGAARPASASLFSTSRSLLTVVSLVSGGGGLIAAAAGLDDGRRGVFSRGEDGGFVAVGAATAAETGSTHSSSRISVEGISHLMSSATDSRDNSNSSDEEDEEEEGVSGVMENDLEPSLTSQDSRVGSPVGTAEAAGATGAGNGASTSLARHGSARSPFNSTTAGRDAEGSQTGSRPSRPGSARRRGLGAHRSSLDSPFAALAEASVDGVSSADETHAAAAAARTTPTTVAVTAPAPSEEALQQQELYEQLVGKVDPAVQKALREGDGGTLYGPSLRDVYARCCEVQQCRPNSYLLQKLPAQPELTYSVEELDLSSNYVGHNGFVAVLHLLEHLSRLRVVYFNNMSLDNVDVESLCYVLASNMTVREVHLENNTGISLPSMRHFTALLRSNPRIEVLALDGTRLSPTLVNTLKAEASRPRI